MDAKLLWERLVAVRNSFPVLVRLLEMDLDETETRLALEVAVERDTLDAPKWFPLDLVPSRHQWKMHTALANLWRDLEDGQGEYLKLLKREHTDAVVAINAEWKKLLEEKQAQLNAAAERAVRAERDLEMALRGCDINEPPAPPDPIQKGASAPAATDSNAQLLIQALIRQTELVIERDAARAEAKRSHEAYMSLDERQRCLVKENGDLDREVRSIHNSVSQVDGGCAAGTPLSIHQRIYALGENLREANRLNRELTRKVDESAREREQATALTAEWRATVDRLVQERTEGTGSEWREALEACLVATIPSPEVAVVAIEGLMGKLRAAEARAERLDDERIIAASTCIDWREVVESFGSEPILTPEKGRAVVESIKVKLAAAEARTAEWRAAIETHFHSNMTPADAMAAIEQLKVNTNVATAWAEQRKKERDEALTTKTLPDVVREFQTSAHEHMGDTFYCTQAELRRSEPGSLNALTADVLDWVMGLHDVLIVVDQNTFIQLRAVGGALAECPLDVADLVQERVKINVPRLSDMFHKVFGRGEKL